MEEEDGAFLYTVQISAPPDWSEDDWWRHRDYAKKIVEEIQSERKSSDEVWILGLFENNVVFDWQSDNPRDLWLHDPTSRLKPVVYLLY